MSYCTRVCTHQLAHAHEQVCVHVYMHAHTIRVCMSVSLPVSICTSTYVHACEHVQFVYIHVLDCEIFK